MSKVLPNIYFYLPLNENITLPENIDTYWRWQTTTSGISKNWGCYHWILQTYLYLKENGVRCHFVRHITSDGILITHIDYLPKNFEPAADSLVVSTLVDRSISSYCDLYVVHSPSQERRISNRFFYIPPWPQVSLIPRNRNRDTYFENAAFFGYPEQLAPELKSDFFQERLRSLGLNWNIPKPSQWNDFSTIDLIIAIRSFGARNMYLNKSVLKLVNAWLAEVPAILGPELSYRGVGKINRDYIEAKSLDEVIQAIEKLQANVEFRNMLVENGKARAKEFTVEKVLQRWIHFLFDVAVPEYEICRRARLKRKYFLVLFEFTKGMKAFAKKILQKLHMYEVLKYMGKKIKSAFTKKNKK